MSSLVRNAVPVNTKTCQMKMDGIHVLTVTKIFYAVKLKYNFVKNTNGAGSSPRQRINC